MNTDPLLLTWLAVSLAGGFYTVLNLRSALRDRTAQRVLKVNGVLQLVTAANLRREATRLAFWAIALGLGLLALFQVRGEWVAWLLIGLMGLQAWNSRLDRRERVEVGRLS